MSRLSSRDRLLAALRYQRPDYVPLIFNSFGFQPPAHLAWTNEYEEAQRWLSLGVDATLGLHVPIVFHPEVKTRAWEEKVPGERYPLMIKEYDTPAGTLRQEVYRTDDWISEEWPGHKGERNEVQLIDDYNVPRSRKFVVETEEDLEKLRYLLHPLPDQAIPQFKERAAAIGRQARELGVLVESTASAGTDLAVWLCGVEGLLYMALDKPQVFAELLDIIHEHDKRNVELLLDTPVDFIVRRAWYEGTAFWSPKIYREHMMPRLKELTAMAHQGGRLMGYIMTTGFMPLLDTFVEIGYDAHYYIDPIQGGPGVDLRKVKKTFDQRIAVIGGMNSAVTLESGSREEIRQAVFDAIAILGPDGGFVLSPVDCIFASTPWQSILTLIEAWKEARDYPAWCGLPPSAIDPGAAT